MSFLCLTFCDADPKERAPYDQPIIVRHGQALGGAFSLTRDGFVEDVACLGCFGWSVRDSRV